MQVTDEADQDRVEDATEHDEVFLMFGDPDTGRPLIKLSVTREGIGIIEYDTKDLADGIRAINRTITQALGQRSLPADSIDQLVARIFLGSDGAPVRWADLTAVTRGVWSTQDLSACLVRFMTNGMIKEETHKGGWSYRITEQGKAELRAGD